MNLRFVHEASSELVGAIAYYEEIEYGLGVRLKEQVWTVLTWIAENPELPRLRAAGHRRVNLRVFPYYLAYAIWEEEIWILGVAHSARRPEYWIDRAP